MKVGNFVVDIKFHDIYFLKTKSKCTFFYKQLKFLSSAWSYLAFSEKSGTKMFNPTRPGGGPSRPAVKNISMYLLNDFLQSLETS